MNQATHSFGNSEKGTRAHHPAGIATLAYGVICYAFFFATIMYAIGFVGNWLVPKSIDTGPVRPIWQSVLINAALLSVFVLQHTIMARPAFKRWWTRIVPRAAERSTFVLLASASLGLVFWQWRPLPQTIWSVERPAAYLLDALALAGWAVMFASSFAISHFDLFGLRQAWLRFRNTPYRALNFRVTGLYRIVRHPLMLGLLIAFWSAPVMSLGRLCFALLCTGYILFGTWMEERDLIAEHGERYLQYRRRVRGLVPLPIAARNGEPGVLSSAPAQMSGSGAHAPEVVCR
ncbi:MAG: NnrU family protein [Phycisphaerae bacterium]